MLQIKTFIWKFNLFNYFENICQTAQSTLQLKKNDSEFFILKILLLFNLYFKW